MSTMVDSQLNDDHESRPRIPSAISDIIIDAAAHGDGRLHDAFTWLRANEPLGIAETATFDPFWVVTRHADIRAIATKPELFLSGETSITIIDRVQQERVIEYMAGKPNPTRMMISMDPPDHPIYRAITAKAFQARTLDETTDKVRAIAREFIAQMAATGGECDFAKTIAFVYPLRVVMSLLGVPREDEPYLLRLTQEMVGTHDPEQARGGVALSGAEAANSQIEVVEDFNTYFAKIMADRRTNPQGDVATLIAEARIDGEYLPTLEALSYYLILATAGHDTTAAATTGGMIELANNPEEFAKIKANPALVNSFVEEAIRWISPAKMTMRTAAQDIEIAGRDIRKGELVGLAWASANRDEEVFDDPFTFHADRKPNKLLSFGSGPHICLGQHLARLEMRVLFEELLKRLEHVELTGAVRSVSSFQISGPKSAPIRFSMN